MSSITNVGAEGSITPPTPKGGFMTDIKTMVEEKNSQPFQETARAKQMASTKSTMFVRPTTTAVENQEILGASQKNTNHEQAENGGRRANIAQPIATG